MNKKSFKKYLKEAFDTEVSTGTIGPDDWERDDEREEKAATGLFGYITKDKNKPFTVNKKPHKAFDKGRDAYFTYIKYIVDHKLAQKNPYFPRVFKFHEKSDESDLATSYDIEIEHLFSYKDISEKELVSLFKRILTPEGFAVVEKKSNEAIAEAGKSKITPNTAYLLMALIPLIELKKLDLMEDENLKKACEIIYDLKIVYGFSEDLGSENFMFRKGRFGIQLVITDPLM